MGTPAYIAPEQARGKAVDHRADLFAFGVVRVGPASGEEPHLLLGHTGLVSAVAISRRGD